MTADPKATAAASLAFTAGVAAVCWVIAVGQMHGMDMGPATPLAPLGSFVALWVAMMGAMMLPGAVPAAIRRAQARNQIRAVAPFIVSYLGVWTLVGVAIYAVYRPHGTVTAGVSVLVAGLYELTPLKRVCRRSCREGSRSGSAFGVSCLGSSIGLMTIMVSLGIMSVTWMAVLGALVAAQKLMAPRAGVDLAVALTLISLGILILAAPAAVPGLIPPMS